MGSFELLKGLEESLAFSKLWPRLCVARQPVRGTSQQAAACSALLLRPRFGADHSSWSHAQVPSLEPSLSLTPSLLFSGGWRPGPAAPSLGTMRGAPGKAAPALGLRKIHALPSWCPVPLRPHSPAAGTSSEVDALCAMFHGAASILRPRTSRVMTKTIWSLYPQGPHPSTERLRVSNKLNLPLVRTHQDQPPSCRVCPSSLPELSKSKPPGLTQT